MTTWFITGCSTGLGRQLALEVLEQGEHVVVTARDVTRVQDLVDRYPDRALGVGLDVGNVGQINDAIAAALSRFGRIDVLVNNAGHGYRAAVEEAEQADLDELFATNFFGPAALIRAVLPGMRERRSGAIVNLSSIAAMIAAPGSGYYSATKCALEGMSDALRKEVGPLGIRVIVVQPGAFRTDFAGRSLLQSSSAIDDYANTAGLRRKENDHSSGTQPGDPVRGSRLIIEAVKAANAPFRLLLGNDAIEVARIDAEGRRADTAGWEERSAATDFPA